MSIGKYNDKNAKTFTESVELQLPVIEMTQQNKYTNRQLINYWYS